MQLALYQVDAFTDQVFAGNSAAIIPLEQWLDDALMQSIAAENNLSETAFIVPEEGGFRIRWFTPTVEVNLCGHATLATAHVLFHEFAYPADEILFYSRSGELKVHKGEERLSLDFPVQEAQACEMPEAVVEAIGKKPQACLKNVDYVLVYENQDDIESINPNHEQVKQTDARGIIVTAPGREHDFVCRFFAAGTGIPEDPVTGSAYTKLVPYWAKRLGKNTLRARQLSKRGGELWLELKQDRVLIAGHTVKYLQGTINI
jgi:PhzF family phenazine biosynthesis protein